MTYSQSAKNVVIDQSRAIQELKSHGIDGEADITLMLQEVFKGEKTVRAAKVLNWLGY